MRIIRLFESLPETRTSQVLGRQLLRSGTSVGANYRAACRARSTADFLSKLGIVEEEADECIYWLGLLVESRQIKQNLVENLVNEANQILAIIVSSIKTARKKQNPQSEINPKSR